MRPILSAWKKHCTLLNAATAQYVTLAAAVHKRGEQQQFALAFIAAIADSRLSLSTRGRMHRKLSERTVGDCTGGDVDIEMIQVPRKCYHHQVHWGNNGWMAANHCQVK